jgi:heme-degrading monooxygenase HmoA
MIVRIVRMSFQHEKVEVVKSFLEDVRGSIIRFSGCEHLDILQDLNQKNVFFSYSHWRSEQDLENYRQSEFFKETWARAKLWFIEKPCAWSLDRL